MIILLFLLLQLLNFTQSAGVNYVKILEDESIGDRLRLLEPQVLLRQHKDNFSKAGVHRTNCERDFAIYKRAIGRRESWALKMLDASSKVPAGLLEGNVVDLGMFDECIEVTSGSSDSNIEIRGRHCMYSIGPLYPISYTFSKNPRLSICVPANCNENDIIELLNRTVYENDEAKDLGITTFSATCRSSDKKIAGKTVFLSIIFLVVCIGFVILCTLCDLVNRKFGLDIFRTLVRFSMIKNAETILSTNVRDIELPVVHGIRVISTAWIMVLHEYFIPLYALDANAQDISKWFLSWSSLLPFVGIYSVDTFFTLSGFLMTYTFFKKMEKQKKFNILLYYVHRFVRLTFPVVTLVTTIPVVIWCLGSSPNSAWLEDTFITGCLSKWWSVIMYTQNFVEKDNYCCFHLWSLSVDMQLFWISPLILYPLYKRPKFGLAIIGSLVLISVTTTAAIVGFNKYSAIYFTPELNIEHIHRSFNDVYTMPYTRASPWLIGILLGYKVSLDNQKPNNVKIYLGWLLAFISFAFCIFGTRSFMDVNYKYNLVWEMTFAASVRPVWAFGICWIIYASTHSSTGIISKFLSWKVFLPLSKISYSAYITNPAFPALNIIASRTSSHYNNYLILQSYIGHVTMSIVLAFLFSLVFEIPMLILEDIVFRKKSKSTSEKKKSK